MTRPEDMTNEELLAALGATNGRRRVEKVELEAVPGDLRQIRRTRWAWRDWAPLGCFLLVAGEGGIGKGVVLCYLLAQFTRGEAPGDLEGTPVNVGWIGFEDNWDETVLGRLAANDADVKRVFDVRVKTRGEFLNLTRDREALGELVDRHNLRVIAFEAIVDHLAGTDDHKNAEVRRALLPVVELARDRQLLVIGTTHLNKTTTGTYRHRVAGSGGYLAVARVGWLVARHPDEPELRVLALGKGNLGRVPPSMVFDIEGFEVENPDSDETADVGRVAAEPYFDRSLTVDEVLAGGTRARGSRESEVRDFLAAVLADGPMKSVDLFKLAEGHGLSEKTVRTHREAADVDLYQKDRAWWWRLRKPEGS